MTQNLENATNDWQGHWNAALFETYGTPPRELVSGRGTIVTDAEGNEYLDLLSGIAVNALGHAHPAIVDAVTNQIATLSHTSNLFAHPQVIKLAERLKGLLGVQSGEAAEAMAGARVFFSNSGAEANEAAFKIARATGKTKILAAERGFHGRTMGALALTGQPDKQEAFKPLPGGVEYYPYGDIKALREMADDDTAAIFLESIQGETGVIPAPDGFLAAVRELCDAHDILMVVDEVQAGMGRTGQWFGFQHEAGVLPDVITMAKGLGGGLPIGATLALPKAQLLAKGMHGTTFGGNPVVCAAANAVIDTIEAEDLLANVATQSQAIRDGLADHPSVQTIRGRGLMLGIVLDAPLNLDPLDYGLIINKPQPDVIRLVPPLNISADEVQRGVTKIRQMLDDNRAQNQ
ncbi:acetylornithine transaminase [Corynebacterium jeikeium]|uniref:Acetylornithine aminotransferase n=1 Tax=Corynebacterium jeikeium (strain K411) TaxID=306537 RepID=Q4JW01_CORJK|nr:acetylornithine transaminase [Corynebacterium jeikeium]EEW17128.1 aminotransferase, acetylornithine/succinylornithine family [Corynebacterium jeikeium ATCC 43734]OOD29590.1 aspartate aminotransferase family protein [Corynebacterium jeikeium]WCZ53412.1 Acetylornithine aminotransferase [Corynebacterium jeikeium]CAI37006.1 acetylornithine aminotransferase [Corynebacterium jeikeium K411]SUY81276.1 acetylornithine aminotransferase [Corynebacterium jeikeium]